MSSLFLARYPTQHQMGTTGWGDVMPPGVTLAQVLQSHGYHTAAALREFGAVAVDEPRSRRPSIANSSSSFASSATSSELAAPSVRSGFSAHVVLRYAS